jgi:polysaccharide export outer membrane protein
VYGIEELNSRDVRADAGGRISFPLVGSIDAAGKTADQIAAEIEQRLRAHYIRNPQVTVNLKEAVSRVITVDGEVREPGLYPVLGRLTLMRAVATAKGLGENAQASSVVVFRTVNGQQLAALYNLQAIRRGVYDDPEVYANDIVIVGDNEARRLFRDFLQVVPLLTTPLIIALQNN